MDVLEGASALAQRWREDTVTATLAAVHLDQAPSDSGNCGVKDTDVPAEGDRGSDNIVDDATKE